MKKIIAIILISIMAISLVACEDKKDTIDTPSAKDNDSVSDKSVKTETTIVADEDLKKEVEDLKKQVSSLSQKESVKSDKDKKQQKLDELYAETEKKYKPQVDALEKELKELHEQLKNKSEYKKTIMKTRTDLVVKGKSNEETEAEYMGKIDKIEIEIKNNEKEINEINSKMSQKLNIMNELQNLWHDEENNIKKSVK